MADNTDKFGLPDNGGGGGIASSSPFQDSKLDPSVLITDGDGKVLNSLPIDPVTNQAIYKKIMTAADIGRKTLSTKVVGKAGFNPKASDSFTTHVKDADGLNGAQGQTPYVQQIVAGPGIYISAPNGKGVVTISTQPFSASYNDLYSITSTISSTAGLPSTAPYEFIVVGAAGLALGSIDGERFDVMGAANSANNTGSALDLLNVISLRGTQWGNGGQIYYSLRSRGTADVICISGGIGVGKDDGLNQLDQTLQITDADEETESRADHILEHEAPYNHITNVTITGQNIFYESGDFNDALSLVFGTEDIFNSIMGVPSDLGAGSSMPLTVEFHNGGSHFGRSASNIAGNSSASYKVVVVDSALEKIWHSVRSGNTIVTDWTDTNLGGPVIGVASNGLTFTACGSNDSIYHSTDGVSWSSYSTGVTGANWNSIAYGNGTWIVVGDGGKVAFSAGGAGTWTEGHSGTSKDLTDIAYNSNLSKFVAVGLGRTIITVNA